MQEYEEEEQFFDNEVEQVVTRDDEAEEEDPKGTAFMRGVEEAVQIRDASDDEDEEFWTFFFFFFLFFLMSIIPKLVDNPKLVDIFIPYFFWGFVI